MSETARQVIEDAISMIWATGEGESIPSYDMLRAIRIFNNMMSSLESDNIDVDFTAITDQADTVTVVDGALLPIKKVLAWYLWPFYYSDPVPAQITAFKMAGVRELSRLGGTAQTSNFPNTLPVGSGNQKTYATGQTYFYTEDS